MPKPKILLQFILGVLAIYTALFLLFSLPPVRDAAFNGIRRASVGALSVLLPKAYFQSQMKASDPDVMLIGVANRKEIEWRTWEARQPGQGNTEIQLKPFQVNVKFFWLMPLLFTFSLAMATPLPWRQQLTRTGLSLLLMALFLFLLAYLNTRAQIDSSNPGLYRMAPWVRNFLVSFGLVFNLGFHLFTALLIWIAVCIDPSLLVKWEKSDAGDK